MKPFRRYNSSTDEIRYFVRLLAIMTVFVCCLFCYFLFDETAGCWLSYKTGMGEQGCLLMEYIMDMAAIIGASGCILLFVRYAKMSESI